MCDTSFEMHNMTLVVSVIALGKEIEVICLLFEARGLESDQLDVLMFKLDSILTRQRAAGGWRNENSILSEKKKTPRTHSFIYSFFCLPDIQYVVLLQIRSDLLFFCCSCVFTLRLWG